MSSYGRLLTSPLYFLYNYEGNSKIFVTEQRCYLWVTENVEMVFKAIRRDQRGVSSTLSTVLSVIVNSTEVEIILARPVCMHVLNFPIKSSSGS